MSAPDLPIQIYNLGHVNYQTVWQQMRNFTDARTEQTPDEMWLVEHSPVFTQGQAGKVEHILDCGDIPLVQSDRGGQVTYHGPGQLVVYPLVNLRRLGIGVRALVSVIEDSVITFLGQYGITAAAKPDAPGVYVEDRKIASLGLRVRRGCSFHGVAININVDLSPFQRINPCGYPGLTMVRLADLVAETVSIDGVADNYAQILSQHLGLVPNVVNEPKPWLENE